MPQTTILPTQPPPPAPGFLVVFSPAQWAWITTMLQAIYAGLETSVETAGPMTNALERLMTQDADLTAAVLANTEAVAGLRTAVDAEIAAVQDLLNQIAAGPAPSQAVADAIAAVQASTAELQSQRGALEVDDAPAG